MYESVRGTVGQIIGFASTEVIDGYLHICQVSVSFEFQSLGAGNKLMAALIAFAKEHDRFRSTSGAAETATKPGHANRAFKGLSLSTDKEAWWNAPWYERMSFNVVEAGKLGSGHEEKRKEEATMGLDMNRRCFMLLDFEHR